MERCGKGERKETEKGSKRSNTCPGCENPEDHLTGLPE